MILNQTPRTTAAGVVVFLPDKSQLVRLINTIHISVTEVFVFLNSAITIDLRIELTELPRVRLIEATENLGIGVALNFIALTAYIAGHEMIVFFDQDSNPVPDTIPRLEGIFRQLSQEGHEPAVVAPRMIGPADSIDSKSPIYRVKRSRSTRSGALAVQFVPTSGSLISIAALRDSGFFRADFFIDGIDIEWSFRAWARGLSCWIAPECLMEHSIGSGTIEIPILGRRMPLQTPLRMYCVVRNTLYSVRLGHIPIGWKAAQLLYLPWQLFAYLAHHGFKSIIARHLIAGITDGLRGRLGTPRIFQATTSASPTVGKL